MVAQKQIPRHTEAKKKGSWSSAGNGSWDFINEEDQMYILYVCVRVASFTISPKWKNLLELMVW